MTLKPPYPSSPFRPPIEHLYFTIHGPEGEQTLFTTHAFAELYSAHAWLEEILDPHPDIKETYINPNTILLRHIPTNSTLTIKGTKLQKALNYQPTKQEQQWRITYPDTSRVEKLTTFYKPKYKPRQFNNKPPEPPKQSPRHKTTKTPEEGYITVAELAQSANIQPNKARNILRKANIKKPKNGWTFKNDDPIVTQIRKLLK